MTTLTKSYTADVLEKTTTRIAELVANLASPSAVAREKARASLVAIGKPAVPLLVPLLSHRATHVRWEAGKALCDIADPIAASALVDALEDREERKKERKRGRESLFGRTQGNSLISGGVKEARERA